MIYRTWSLLTGPAVIVGGVVATVVVSHFILAEKGVIHDPYLKRKLPPRPDFESLKI